MTNTKSTPVWRIVNVEPENDKALLNDIRNQYFGSRDEAYIQWLYYDNPAGKVFGALAMDGDTVAGQYIIIPVNMVIDGEDRVCTISLDTFTHPDYRRQGIFVALSEAMFARLKDLNIPFTVGLPNENSRPGFLKKLNFSEPLPTRFFLRPLSLTPTSGPFIRKLAAWTPWGLIPRATAKLKGFVIEACDFPDTEWLDRLWQDYRPLRSIEIRKDAQWAAWRYRDNPRFSYRFITVSRRDGSPVGYLVWNSQPQQGGSGRNIIDLIDMVWTDATALLPMLSAFFEETSPYADAVVSMNTMGTANARALMATGFVPRQPGSFIIRTHRDDMDMSPYYRKGIWDTTFCYADVR